MSHGGALIPCEGGEEARNNETSTKPSREVNRRKLTGSRATVVKFLVSQRGDRIVEEHRVWSRDIESLLSNDEGSLDIAIGRTMEDDNCKPSEGGPRAIRWIHFPANNVRIPNLFHCLLAC
jgi:hypothetical protein